MPGAWWTGCSTWTECVRPRWPGGAWGRGRCPVWDHRRVATWIWIVIAVVVVVAIAFGFGLSRARAHRVSLTEAPKPQAPKPVEGEKPKGGYKAGGSISFSAGSGAATAPKERTRPPALPEQTSPAAERTETDGEPGVGEDAAVPRDEIRRNVVDVDLPAVPDEVIVPDDLSTLEATPPATGVGAAPA